MLVKACYHFDSLRTVVHLVKPTPQKRRLVTPAVPPVVCKRHHDVADDRATRDPQPVCRPRAVPHHPAIPADTGKPYRTYLNDIEANCSQPPAAYLRPGAPGGKMFDHHHHDRDTKHGQEDCHRPLRDL